MNIFTLEPLSLPEALDWGGEAMRFDRIPTECRERNQGRSDRQRHCDQPQTIARIDHGIDIRSGEGRSWTQDSIGHGTPCAGVIGAIPIAPTASAATRRTANCTPAGCLPTRVAATLWRRSTIVWRTASTCVPGVWLRTRFGHRRAAYRGSQEQGIAIIAAAGNSAGTVLFPACSPHVMAVGAIGQAGSFPEDSPQAVQRRQPRQWLGGCSCRCSPVVGRNSTSARPASPIIACQSPDSYALAMAPRSRGPSTALQP